MDVRDLVNIDHASINRRAFVDWEVYEQELERIFGRCWLFLAHESQLPSPGDFVTAYMAEDPILVVRDQTGTLRAFLNTCRHRGNRVCRADAGNTGSFLCAYHGWTYGLDGRLLGVPGWREYYYEELGLEQWGLVPVAQVATYKGLIFGTLDGEAPPLREYLGEMTYYLDLMLDRREGGTEVIGGVHKWVMPCNWKFAAENFSGEGYHITTTHYSAQKVLGNPNPGRIASENERAGAYAGNGHSISLHFSPDLGRGPANIPYVPALKQYLAAIMPEKEQRLGPVRAGLSTGAANVFPNFSLLLPSHTIRVWHPRGPEKTEVWSWCVVDKAAPPEAKEAMRRDYQETFGPSGIFEQDDGDNWGQATSSGRGWAARKRPFNYQMGRGHERYDEAYPGRIGPRATESNMRGFYGRWLQLMRSQSWADVPKNSNKWVQV